MKKKENIRDVIISDEMRKEIESRGKGISFDPGDKVVQVSNNRKITVGDAEGVIQEELDKTTPHDVAAQHNRKTLDKMMEWLQEWWEKRSQ